MRVLTVLMICLVVSSLLTQLLGVFDLEDYIHSSFTQILFLTFSVAVVLIFLYIYIAIVLKSYEKVQATADRKFGKWRIEFAAGQISLQNHLKNFHLFESGIGSSRVKQTFVFNWILLIAFLVIFCLMSYYNMMIIYEVIDDDAFYDIGGGGLKLFFNIASLICILCVAIFLMIYLFRKQMERCNDCSGIIEKAIENFFHSFGILKSIRESYFQGKKDSEELEILTNIIVKKAEERINKRIEEMEERVLESGINIKSELGIIAELITSKDEKKYGRDDSIFSEDSTSTYELTKSDVGLSKRYY